MGHGSLLAGRYRLEERVRTGADGSLWRAVDETLDRPVSVRVVRPGHRYTADVIDAARRAALVEDARLVRVLDVGESGGSAYIVSEHLVGRTLDEVLTGGPLPADTARRLVGEAAQALDRASARGLHHLQLTPSSLVVTPDGNVKVLGTAVEAALAGIEHEEDPIGADRQDAVGLVRVLYAGLTGRWPGTVDGPLGPAPRVTGRAVPPADLVAGIPNDLDTLCAVTLGPHDDGPHSPGELAHQLAPWGLAEPVTGPGGGSAPAGASASSSSPPSTPGSLPSAPAAASAPSAPATPRPAAAGTLAAASASAARTAGGNGAAPSSSGASAAPEATEPGSAAKVARHATPARGVPGSGEPALPTLLPREAGARGDDRLEPPLVIDLTTPATPVATGARPAGGTVTHTAPGNTSATAAGTPRTTTVRNGSAPSGRTPAGTRPAGDLSTGGLRLPRSGGGNGDDWTLLSRPERAPGRVSSGDTEPLGPFIPPAPVTRPPRDQARFVLAVVAGLVALGLILAVFSLRGLFGSADPAVQPAPLIPTATTPTTTRSAAAAPPPSPAPAGAAVGSPSPSGTPAEISGIQAIDPQGDGNESGSTADRAIDGDPGTTWRSDRYQSASFGGLKKGLGLYLHLSGDTVSSVTITMPGRGGAVELRTANGPGLDSSSVVATAGAQDGKAVLTPVVPLPGGPLLLWFTELPQQDSGEYRLVVSEISLT